MCLGPEKLGMNLFSLTPIFLENTASPTPSVEKRPPPRYKAHRGIGHLMAMVKQAVETRRLNLVIPANQLR